MRINTLYLLALFMITGLSSQSQTIILPGYVSGTWTEASSPYYVEGPIEIHEDSSLMITENVLILFNDTAKMIVRGQINAIGTSGGEISFSSSSLWKGIEIYVNPSWADTSKFELCIFEFALHWDIIDGGGVYIENRSEVVFSDCWFYHNNAKEKGGGLYLKNADIRINNSIFYNNKVWDTITARGGAIYMEDSDPIIYGSVFENNEALNGGAVYCVNSSPIFNSSKFQSNSSRGGGGAVVFNDNGNPIIKYCRFEFNEANGSGGGIAFLEGIQAIVERCSFINNSCSSDTYLADGGAVLITPYDNLISFVNCEFSSNYAEDFGGALYITSPTNVIGCLFNGNIMPTIVPSFGGAIAIGETSLRIINSTFANNIAQHGPFLFCEDSEVLILNSILWDEDGSDPGVFIHTVNDPSMLFVDYNNIMGGEASISGVGQYFLHWGNNNIELDPHFIDPYADFSFAWNSPCINAGTTDTLQLLIPVEDIDGNPRIMGGEIDMGCYEYQGPIHITEVEQSQDFLVYPNPSRKYCYIRNNSGTGFSGQLILSDLSGRILMERKAIIANHASYRISLSSIPEGMYFLTLVSESSKVSRKILVTGY